MLTETMPVRSITMNESDLHELRRDGWSKSFKHAKLKIGDKFHTALIGIRGGHTRNYPKKSFEIRLDNGMTYHWNAEYDDPSMMRNALSFAFFNQIHVPAPITNPIWLSINGVQEGVYLEIEAVNDHFFRKRGIGYRSLIYAVHDNADFSLIDPDSKASKTSLFNGYELVIDKGDTKKRLISFIRHLNGLSGKELSSFIARRLDIKQYLLWLAGAVLTGNYDGFDQNYALYERAVSKRYRIIPWDYEGTWGRNCYGNVCGNNLVRLEGYNTLTEKLFTINSCRSSYAAIMKRLIAEEFTHEKLDPLIDLMHRRLTPAIRNDYTRKASYDSFLAEPAFIRTYIDDRREMLREALLQWK
ncbi:CotH kinase family protein [Paenibacillus harenae]|uniref:Spore coat protein H n=1 Tax=Paenibacillus harenae TaxID=306543 RepID=A0ABT9TUE1_PAEHA|nr:CotH kinase family protein [Paenibacillus harenae]MDQ0110977.1 spore coat protein H [Paenibacillus harenae]